VRRPVPKSASNSTSTQMIMPDTPTARMAEMRPAFRLSVTLGAMSMARATCKVAVQSVQTVCMFCQQHIIRHLV